MNRRHKDFQSFALPTELSNRWRSWRELNPRSPLWQRGVLTATLQDHGCGSRTWTYDLQVMSLTSYQLLHPAINGGGGGIRTPAHLSAPVGFQDRSLQPDLGTPPFWWIMQDSNLRPTGYEPGALTNWANDPYSQSALWILLIMVAGERFELSTFRVWAGHSNQLSYPAVWWSWWASNPQPSACKADALPIEPQPQNGRENRIRTCDPLVPNQVLYQAELLPVWRA